MRLLQYNKHGEPGGINPYPDRSNWYEEMKRRIGKDGPGQWNEKHFNIIIFVLLNIWIPGPITVWLHFILFYNSVNSIPWFCSFTSVLGRLVDLLTRCVFNMCIIENNIVWFVFEEQNEKNVPIFNVQ